MSMVNQRRFWVFLALCVLAWLTAGCGQKKFAQFNQTPVRVSAPEADAAEPTIAAARDGTFYVVWVEHQGDKGADIFCAPYDHNGRNRRQPVRVNPEPGAATAWRGDPPTAAVAPDGTLYIGWTARVPNVAPATNLYLSASRDGGQTFTAPVRVNDDTAPGEHGMHSLTISPDGRILTAWLDERNTPEQKAQTYREPAEAAHGVNPGPGHEAGAHGKETAKPEPNRAVFMSYSTDGGRTFAPNQRLATDACPCCKTALAVNATGRVYVSWRQVLPDNFRHIAVAASSNSGQSFGAPVIVSDDRWQLTSCPVSGAALAIAQDGALRALWYSEGAAGAPGLYWAESRDGGRTFSARQSFVAGRTEGTPAMLVDEKAGLVAVWEAGAESANHPTIAKFPAAGTAPTPVTVAAEGSWPVAALSRSHMLLAYVVKSGDKQSVWVTHSE